MGWKVYELMCCLFLEGDDPEYSFAHCFLTLEWNLMAWSENVVDCHAGRIIWIDDSLGFTFPMSKTDQMCKNADPVWHAYATPHNPITCLILFLVCYLFYNAGILTPVPTVMPSCTSLMIPGNPLMEIPVPPVPCMFLFDLLSFCLCGNPFFHYSKISLFTTGYITGNYLILWRKSSLPCQP